MMSYQYFFHIFHCKIHLLRFMFSYFTLIYAIYVISLYFIFNRHRALLLSQILNQLLSDIFKHNLCYRQINTHPTHVWSPPHIKKWNTETYLGSAYRVKINFNSDINRLASDHIQKYTTETNQCWQFLWTWMWHLQYCDSWYHLDNRYCRI